jgi:DNA repair exonuclease SbcCD ATPase subunit
MAARFFSPDYGEKEFQACRELERHLRDSGYLGVAESLARWEKERGVVCTEALDASEQLLEENDELEQKVADRGAKLETVEDNIRRAEDRYQQVKGELDEVKAERERQEKELAAFRKKAEKEKQAIEKELEQCRQEANVAKEEIITAGKLKAEVEKHGFSLDLVLGLSQEFAGSGSVREELAKGLKEGQTLTDYIKRAEQRKKALETDVKNLELSRLNLESNLSQLRADASFEDKLRRFYHRYQNASVLMEQLATWKEIYFVGCGNPTYAATKLLDRFTKGARFWTEKPPAPRCACCNYPLALWDKGLYQALNWELGVPFELKLGE